ncbi:hypothetical protein [Epinotia aporema granulovirus]|uniref:Uncharacterized protein n=1 Tax=Epinotia aporema granulovirus TaxID=166056 RepID=K4ERV2_9BBAC|nr:hypothetical protein [Epinotia aporema granulovirus]AER41530.1 hypothetical protein [Epinotia aporema granulovirus]
MPCQIYHYISYTFRFGNTSVALTISNLIFFRIKQQNNVAYLIKVYEHVSIPCQYLFPYNHIFH